MSKPRPPATAGSITVHLVHAGNPYSPDPDGIVSVQRNFVAGAPKDFRFLYWGVARPGVVPEPAEGRGLQFLPVTTSGVQRPRVPLALRFSARVALRPPPTGDGSVLRFDRVEPAQALLRSRTPKVLFLHHGRLDDLLGDHSDSRWRWAGRLYRHVLRRVVRGVDQVYVLGEGLREELIDVAGVGEDRVARFGVPVDTELFRLLSEDERGRIRAELAMRLGIPTSVRIVVFAGRLERIKRPGLMVEAAGALGGAGGDEVHLVMAGTGSLRTSVGVDAARLAPGRVHLLGSIHQGHLARLLGAADAFALTSASEASPNVVLEALAAGCPVVATRDADGAARMVRPGVTGAVCHPDPTSVAGALRDVLSRPREATACRSAALEASAGRVNQPVYRRFRELAGAPATGEDVVEPWLLPVGEAVS